MRELRSKDEVLYAEENVPIEIHGEPNDKYLRHQWYLESIQAKGAWELTEITENKVTVAVIDSGVDSSHPDLQGKVIPGYNFIADNTETKDENGHGTAVSGVIAAIYNNEIGITGVSADAKVEILPLKVAGADGKGLISDMIHAVDYAVDYGVDVINISMGASSHSSILEDSIQDAINHDILVISSAGNEGNTSYNYPASYEPVLSVGSVSKAHNHSTFSNYNDRVDVVAPGEGIITTGLSHSYMFYDGTSFSSAILSGMAAYIKATNPSLSADETANIIKETVIDLGPIGKDDKFGYGLVNFAEAVSKNQEKPIPITDINFEKETLTLVEGETTQLIPIITPTNATDKNVIWKSKNENVASVNQSGQVTAISPGKAEISVSIPDGKVVATILITVNRLEQEFSIPEGYKELEKLKIRGNDFYLQVKFTIGIDPSTVDHDTVYILDQDGQKLDIQYQFESDYEKLNIITRSTHYEMGKPYYLFVDKGVTSKSGKPLSQPIINEFMWDKETDTLTTKQTGNPSLKE